MAEVRARLGVPLVADFGGLGAPTLCAPIVVNSTTGFVYTLKADGTVFAAGVGAPTGASGSFTTTDGKTVTVVSGLITAITP